MGLIRAAHIERLADMTEGKDRLGELVRRLIWAWLPNRVSGIHFLSGETNNYAGWDGWLRLDLAAGCHNSVWELSARRDKVEKIRSDFASASSRALPPGWSRASTTYVAVTARSLGNKEGLEEELRSLKPTHWADVRIIDAKALEQWIEKSPAVEQWAMELFSVTGVIARTTLTRYWAEWSEVTSPPISPKLMVAGRDLAELGRDLSSADDRSISVQADSPEEVVGVVFAVLDQFPREKRDRLLFNATVLTSEESAQRIADEPVRDEGDPLTILLPPATSQAQRLVRKGHKVVIALGRNTPSVSQLTLRRSLRADFERALSEHMAVSQSQAATDARACGASVSIWRVWHLLRIGAAERIPVWARGPARKAVIPAVFARAWDDATTHDREILALLAARSYSSYADEIHEFSACDDPLHERVGTVHKVIAPSVAYALVRDAITPSQFEQLRQAMIKVFTTVDQDVADVWDTLEVETPEEDGRDTYSSWLKDGLAETLLAIAFLPQPNTGVLHPYGGGDGFANALVRALPGLADDPRLLASLRDQLPLLAEAAPIPFVEALEELLQGGSDLSPLFRDRGLFGAAYHVGLLWALQTLAWSPDLLSRVTSLLLDLSERGETGRSGNTPLGSLREIYLAWLRGTSASGEARTSILRSLAATHPLTVWRLLLSLLPKDHDTSSGTHQPAWRDFGRSDSKPLSRRDVARTYRAYAELALDLAEGSIERQLDLLEFYAQLPDEYRARLLALLDSSSPPGKSAPAWTRLRDFIAKNRAFATASWAVDAQGLERMQLIASKLAPPSRSERDRWIFDEAWPELGERGEDFERRDEVLRQRRLDTLGAILDEEGVDAVDALARDARAPHTLGSALAALSRPNNWIAERLSVWAAGGNANELSALQAASGARHREQGEDWTSTLIDTVKRDHWSQKAVAYALLDFSPTGATFELVEKFGPEVERIYWQKCWLHADWMDDAGRGIAPTKLIFHGRPTHALDLVNHRFTKFGAEAVLEIVRATVSSLLNASEPSGHMDSYHLEEALSWLRSQSSVAKVDVARLEYPLIPLLTRGHREGTASLVLHDLLAQDPSFFAQVISDVYKPRNKPQSDAEIDESRRARARAGWNLLRSWTRLPGQRDDGTIDDAAMRTWIKTAVDVAREVDRLEVAMIKIGEVMYHAKPDPQSGEWPPAVVLDVIEDLASNDLERGFSLEVVNTRGATMRAPLSGGALERELQHQWEERAANLDPRWQRSKGMFQRIAEDWRRQATWHDQHSEHDRLRWS